MHQYPDVLEVFVLWTLHQWRNLTLGMLIPCLGHLLLTAIIESWSNKIVSKVSSPIVQENMNILFTPEKILHLALPQRNQTIGFSCGCISCACKGALIPCPRLQALCPLIPHGLPLVVVGLVAA
jgi:hypothetical protein